MISSSARRRRKCWSEIEHNESIEELFDRMAANTPPIDMDTNTISCDDDVTTAKCTKEHDHREDKQSKK